MKRIVLYSLRRSGQHAVIQWLCKQMEPAVHFNDCFIENGEIKNDRTLIFENGQHSFHRETKDPIAKYMPNLVIHNFEDKHVKPSKHPVVVVVRDLYNLMASRKKRMLVAGKCFIDFKATIEVWKEHLKALDDENIIGINFNKWFKSKDYRGGIAYKLGIPFTDAGINNIYRPGTSSFDGMKYQSRAQEMPVFDRWAGYVKDPEYMGFFTDELKKLNLKHFNFAPF